MIAKNFSGGSWRAFITGGLVVVVTACVSAQHKINLMSPDEFVMSPGELLTKADEFDQQEVIVEGWMESGFERYRIWDTKEAQENGDAEKKCVGLAIPRPMATDGYDKSHVRVHGKFVRQIASNMIVLGGCKNRAALHIAELPTPSNPPR